MFLPWPDIESFYNLRRSIKKYPELAGDNPTVTYRAKVKLHGTNAGIRVNKDKAVYAQSRSRSITPEDDNDGFARWVAENENTFHFLSWEACYYFERDQGKSFDVMKDEQSDVIIYGEWCGPGIQKGVAINEVEEKTFAVFAILHVDSGDLMVDPATIVNVFSRSEMTHPVRGLKVIPWYSNTSDVNPPVPYQVDIDFNADEEGLKPILDSINENVSAVEQCDPWVKQEYGIEGVGEGLVFYPVSPSHHGRIRDLFFKAKGEKHKVVAKTKPAQANVPVAEGVLDFVEMVLPPARLEQGARAVNNGDLLFEQKKIGDFLKWIVTDLKKEIMEELLASGLEEKSTFRACSDRARAWYMEQVKKA